MIECTDKNVYYKKRRKPKKIFGVFLLLAIIVGIYFYYNIIVEKTIIGVCEDYLKSYSTKSVNAAVLEIVKSNPYSDYVSIEKNDQGDIILISTDSLKINELNKKIAQKTEENLSKMFSEGIKIPLLAFTGIKLISGYGTPINFKMITVSSVQCDFDDSFVSAGINQTMHSLFISVETCAALTMPGERKTETCKTRVLLGEAVIVGKIPEIYLNR